MEGTRIGGGLRGTRAAGQFVRVGSSVVVGAAGAGGASIGGNSLFAWALLALTILLEVRP